MRGLINNGSLSQAPLGLSVIVCTLAACVHLPPNLPVLNTPWGRLLLPSPGWLKRRPLGCGGSRGIPSQPVQMGPQRNMVPLRRAWDSGPEWMAEFAAINPWLPNYLIYQMHSRLLCNCGNANKHSHTDRESAEDSEIDASELTVWQCTALCFTLRCLHVLIASHYRYIFISIPELLAFVSEMSSGLCW